ncbi:hypothetical protein CL634_06185 [bacterium]|nr:hypothetical protein [bacterium]
MQHKNATIKELKEILKEHNCAIPTGARKLDLVKLVEEIMMKDEDFVATANDFENLFEEDLSEAISEKIDSEKQEEDVVQDDTPSIGSSEWTNYVMSQFDKSELIDGNPICAGLRRVTELVLGDIIESGPVQVFPADDSNGPGRATVVFQVIIRCFDDVIRSYSEVADVWHGNTDDLFCAHPVATASTRAEGRALRKALKLRVLAAEELAKKDIVEIVQQSIKSLNQMNSITNQQIQFVDNFCSRFDINVINFINMGEESYDTIFDISKDKAAKMIKFLNQYQKSDTEVPESIKGYDQNWRSL